MCSLQFIHILILCSISSCCNNYVVEILDKDVQSCMYVVLKHYHLVSVLLELHLYVVKFLLLNIMHCNNYSALYLT